jgi:hypothetical protein
MKPAATRAKPVQMCCVQVGYTSLLMPADKGMKVVEMLQSAFLCKRNYEDGGYAYVVQSQPDVELSLVRPDQVRASTASDCAPPQHLPAPRRP